MELEWLIDSNEIENMFKVRESAWERMSTYMRAYQSLWSNKSGFHAFPSPFILTCQQTTILDKSPWDSLKIWHVFANCSVFDALEGRVCAKWRPPPPWSMLLRKSALSAHWYNIERGRGGGGGGGGGGNRRGAISAGAPTLLSRIVAKSLNQK